MSEVLLKFQSPVAANDGRLYEARAIGAEMPDGMWEGAVEFTPIDGGSVLRTRRETTQPNRADTVYWATGLTPIYLEGALSRASEVNRSSSPAQHLHTHQP
jgi:hypothetical protein